MCGRYTLNTPGEVVAEIFGLAEIPELQPRFNIAPTQESVVIRAGAADPAGRRELATLRWGLVPSWAEEPSIGGRLINARSESVAEKPAFRGSFKNKRCIVLADGFYEWQKLPGGKKQPWHLRLASGKPFAIAGLWSRWSRGDSPLETFALLTTSPNAVAAQVHDRMPVILDPDEIDLWLDPTVSDRERLEALFDPYAAEAMVAYPVSTRVNSPAFDDPSLVEPLAIEPPPEPAQRGLF